MGQNDIKANLENYVQCFSKDAREIFEHFKFTEFVGLLDDANLLICSQRLIPSVSTTYLGATNFPNRADPHFDPQ